MIYTPLTKKAMILAFNAHKNQTDKSGIPYIFHPIHIAEQMIDENTTIAALLHDVLEDSDVTVETLLATGFSHEVISAVQLLTHHKDIPYLDYIASLKNNPIAKTVKLADLKHNSDVSRLNIIDEKAIARIEKYKNALTILIS